MGGGLSKCTALHNVAEPEGSSKFNCIGVSIYPFIHRLESSVQSITLTIIIVIYKSVLTGRKQNIHE